MTWARGKGWCKWEKEEAHVQRCPKLTAGGVCVSAELTQNPIPLYRVGNTEVSRGEVSPIVSEGPGSERGSPAGSDNRSHDQSLDQLWMGRIALKFPALHLSPPKQLLQPARLQTSQTQSLTVSPGSRI